MSRNIIPLVVITILFGCSKYDYSNSELNNSEFQPYVDTFLAEANIRGYDIDLNSISFYLADIENENVGGLCNQRKEEIIIDKDGWESLTEINKELLIFHELGHCILGRDHRNETSENGDCLSIMNGEENNFNCSKNIYSDLWREYYLDELFNKSSVLPGWYSDNQEYITTYTNQLNIVSIEDLNTNFYETSFDFNEKEKYVIEFTFKNWSAVASANNDDFVGAGINFGGFFFDTYPLSEGQLILIYERDTGRLFTQSNFVFRKDIKLTIVKNATFLKFFVDEQFAHIMEVKTFKNNQIEAFFDGPINMDINIFEFE